MKKTLILNSRKFTTQASLDSYVWGICDILRRSNCAGALQYVPELTWILFLRILDDTETQEAERAEAVGAKYKPSLKSPYRWQDWADPQGKKRIKLQNGALGAFFGFVNGELLPYLKSLRDKPNANSRQKVISEILSGVERVRVDTEKNFLDVLDKVHEIRHENIDTTHIFALSQVYEGLLLKMGEKGNDGGQFFTPREVIRAMIRAVEPKLGKTIYDPCCGTGGFLAQSYEYLDAKLKSKGSTPDQIETLKTRTFYGREKENLIYPIALSNLVLHGIDEPHLWHGNALTGQEIYGGLFLEAPSQFDYILTNPPFGGKEGIEAQTRFAYKTRATQVLFLQHVIDSLRTGGTCGIVLDEKVFYSAPTKPPLCKPSGNYSMIATCGQLSVCRVAYSPRQARASRPICCSSPKGNRPRRFGITTCPISRSARRPRSHPSTLKNSSSTCPCAPIPNAVGRSHARKLKQRISI